MFKAIIERRVKARRHRFHGRSRAMPVAGEGSSHASAG